MVKSIFCWIIWYLNALGNWKSLTITNPTKMATILGILVWFWNGRDHSHGFKHSVSNHSNQTVWCLVFKLIQNLNVWYWSPGSDFRQFNVVIVMWCPMPFKNQTLSHDYGHFACFWIVCQNSNIPVLRCCHWLGVRYSDPHYICSGEGKSRWGLVWWTGCGRIWDSHRGFKWNAGAQWLVFPKTMQIHFIT